MNIYRMEKVVLKKAYDNKLSCVGEVFQVANITDTAVIIRDARTRVAIAAIEIDKFEEYFAKPEEVTSWSEWRPITAANGMVIAFYRTNYKKVQVKTLDGVRAEATCNKAEDTFNLKFGVYLAYNRCQKKIFEKIKQQLTNDIEKTNRNIAELDSTMRNMINSLVSKNV